MYKTILLSVALQRWERYSTHAIAARDVAATLATGTAIPVHVLSVYEYEPVRNMGLPHDLAVRHQDDMRQRTDTLMERRMEEFITPLKVAGLQVIPVLRVGKPREVITEVARSVTADVLIVGSHSKRGVLDIALGGTARHITHEAPCTVLMVSPKV